MNPAGTFASNGFNVGLSLPLNVFNRNQGNIKAAQIGINQAQKSYEATAAQVQNQILAAYTRVQILESALKTDKER